MYLQHKRESHVRQLTVEFEPCVNLEQMFVHQAKRKNYYKKVYPHIPYHKELKKYAI